MKLGQDLEERLIEEIAELEARLEFIKTEKPKMMLATMLSALFSVLCLFIAALLFGIGHGGGGCFGVGVAICLVSTSFFCGSTWSSMNSTESAYKQMVMSRKERLRSILKSRENYES